MRDIELLGVMLSDVIKYFYVLYFSAVSVAAIFMCIKDKVNAKGHKKRISEASLLCISALGGSLFMFFTMLIIRHKIKHPKFMIGLPLMILLHLSIAYMIII